MNSTVTISDRVLNMEESATLKMAGLARKLRQEGKDYIVRDGDILNPRTISRRQPKKHWMKGTLNILR